ncbi:hypothetical protein [Fructobacillus papyrifericola]|uniref:Uncharacterized protein n=1 Tax=Fructobacillus papyrifericola TaxID=2713172 RepID=A0ABS5QSL6_9LACO|nr:hypothetical protein [Fructobacillus papyrifericola]MBS9336189.1 hypothetical protein [Fructobacillus papyrifericola]
MKIELIESLDKRAEPAVNWQIEQVKQGKADRLFLLQPHEDAVAICQTLGLALDCVFDMASQRLLSDWPEGEGRFLFDLPVPNQGQINLGDEGLVSLRSQGKQMAKVVLFADSYYLVQALSWIDQTDQVSRKEIFLRTGQLFAKQYFNRGQLLQSDFYFGEAVASRSDFYFDGRRNFALVNGQEYPSYEAAAQDLMQKVAGTATVEITSAGALATIAKTAVLACPEGLFDQNDQVDAAVLTILQNPGHPVERVLVSRKDFAQAKMLGLPMEKMEEFVFD